MNILIAVVLWLSGIGVVLAQTSPGFQAGQQLPAAQLNQAFINKSDFPTPTLPPGNNSNNPASTAYVDAAVAAGPAGGGSTSGTVASPAVLAASVLPTTLTRIRVIAMAATGSSTCGLEFTKGTATPTGIFGEVLNVPSGIYWEPQYVTQPVQACQFGTVADGSFNNTTNATGGTDNAPMIQGALNYALQNNWNTVCLNDGRYKTDDTLQLGWGDSFYSISLASCNGGRSGSGCSSAGVCLIPTKTDRCAINIQGGRNNEVKGLSLAGQSTAYFFFATGGGPIPHPWPILASGWLRPDLVVTGTTSGGIQRYAPYAGICTDAYAGMPPSSFGAAQYPFVANQPTWTTLITSAASISQASPAVVNWGVNASHWLGANCNLASPPPQATFSICPIIFTAGSLPTGYSLNTLYYVKTFLSGNTFTISATPGGTALNNTNPAATALSASKQFGMSLTSNVLVEDSDIQGFGVQISSDSSPADGNNDFLKINRVNIANGAYGIQVGNGQSRNVSINNVTTGFLHTWVTNNKFGVQQGKMGGPINNMSGGQSYQLFDIGSLSLGFPLTIKDCYSEGTVRLGAFSGGSTANGILIDGCDISFAPLGSSQVVPVAYIEAPSGSIALTLRNVNLGSGNRIDQLIHGPATLIIDGGSWVNGTGGGSGQLAALNLPAIPVAFNYTGGLFVSGTAMTFPVSNGMRLQWLNTTTTLSMPTPSTFSSGQLQPVVNGTTRVLFTQATTGFMETLENRFMPLGAGTPNGNATMTTTSPALACDVLTFNYPSGNMAVAAQISNINPGDILYWGADGTFFVVTQVGVLSAGNYPITARQMNNMNIDTNGACVTSNINDPTFTGNMTIIHTAGASYADVAPVGAGVPAGIFIPMRQFFGDFVAGSTAVNNVSISQGAAATTLSTYVNQGDLFFALPFTTDPNYWFPYALGSKVASVTNGVGSAGGTITLNVAPNATGRFPISPLPIIGAGVGAQQSPLRYSAAGIPVPTCNAATNGQQIYVSDATAPTYHGAYVSGGTLPAGVLCISGTGWVTN